MSDVVLPQKLVYVGGDEGEDRFTLELSDGSKVEVTSAQCSKVAVDFQRFSRDCVQQVALFQKAKAAEAKRARVAAATEDLKRRAEVTTMGPMPHDRQAWAWGGRTVGRQTLFGVVDGGIRYVSEDGGLTPSSQWPGEPPVRFRVHGGRVAHLTSRGNLYALCGQWSSTSDEFGDAATEGLPVCKACARKLEQREAWERDHG